ncbi:unnamed protein product [Adineta steineri]|uniref:F-box domain-containing protein n=2 Tax=Adineta steineri TaxID=433720 RepID=A0A819GJQ1_9BILA|nr:unnamed protein product [Adineta steineri]
MLSSFEILPNEILMIIMKYSGNVFTIFRTYFGLNQRLNNILLNKRLHLLTDFLHINVCHTNLDNYHNCHIFQEVSMKNSITEEQLHLCFQSLVAFYINEQYIQLGKDFELNTENIETIRKSFTNEELLNVNNELKNLFNDLSHRVLHKSDVKRIEWLIFQRGACLECNDHHFEYFNLAKALNKFLFAHIDNTRSITRQYAHSIVELFKLLILSNANLLKNRDDIGCGGCQVYYFLFSVIYQFECINYRLSNYFDCVSFNMNCYRSVIDLSLFIIQCQKQIFCGDDWCNGAIFEILSMLTNSKNSIIDDQLFIQISRLEILKILFNEHVLQVSQWDESLIYIMKRTLRNLILRNYDCYEYI